MLPSRSKRYAGIDGEIPRLKLATWQQLLLFCLLIGTLLTLVFPRKQLVSALYKQESVDELTLSYIQNLYRSDTSNADVALLLARVQQQQLDLQSLQKMLLGPAANGDLRQRTVARDMLLTAYEQASPEQMRGSRLAELRNSVSVFMETAVDDDLTEDMAQRFAGLAFRHDLIEQGLRFSVKAGLGNATHIFETRANSALALGQYQISANYFFRAQEREKEIAAQRRLFKAGLDTLMSGGLYAEAIAAAKDHLGPLEHDVETLRYLARMALAAGQPTEASRYAKALMFEVRGAHP